MNIIIYLESKTGNRVMLKFTLDHKYAEFLFISISKLFSNEFVSLRYYTKNNNIFI